MKKPRDANEFLRAMGQGVAEPAAEAPQPAPSVAAMPEPASPPAPPPRKPASRKKSQQSELKHFGGYLDDVTFEKIALLRVRLKKDNSALIKLAIEELERKHSAKRAFGDS